MYLGGAVGGELMQAMWALNSHPSFYGMSIVPGEVIAKVLGAGPAAWPSRRSCPTHGTRWTR